MCRTWNGFADALVHERSLMLSLKPNQLKPGMVLSKDVINLSGILLLKSGNSLKIRDIKNFKAWGISETFVQESLSEGTFQEDEPQVDPKLLEEAEEESAVLFRHCNSGHPIVREMKRLCTLNKVQQKTRLMDYSLKST